MDSYCLSDGCCTYWVHRGWLVVILSMFNTLIYVWCNWCRKVLNLNLCVCPWTICLGRWLHLFDVSAVCWFYHSTCMVNWTTIFFYLLDYISLAEISKCIDRGFFFFKLGQKCVCSFIRPNDFHQSEFFSLEACTS